MIAIGGTPQVVEHILKIQKQHSAADKRRYTQMKIRMILWSALSNLNLSVFIRVYLRLQTVFETASS
jgi:hypothetical protein